MLYTLYNSLDAVLLELKATLTTIVGQLVN